MYNSFWRLYIEAIADDGYHFAQWSDGNTDNPRKVEVKKNITYTAQFAEGESQGLHDLESETKPTKLIRDGQVYILRGDKTYSTTGAEVK